MMRTFLQRHSTQLIWLLLLLLLYLMDTTKATFSFCLFRLIGFESCPGCGLGHAIHDALHFQLKESFQAHPLGIPAVIGILYHVIHAFYQSTKRQSPLWTTNKC
jgi:hypothetical protein